MINLTLPSWVKEHSINYSSLDEISPEFMEKLKNDLKKYKTDNPVVSIVIPAYNEEKDLIKTLCSFSKMNSHFPTELIVANNNSTDRTQEIIDRLEVKNVFVPQQGVAFARQAGLEMAKGKYILSADSDSIYPSTWINAFVEALQNPEVTCVYGQYSFIPSVNSRPTLALYEAMARTMFQIKSKNRECVNVMGFNSAFRKEDAMKAGGYPLNLRRDVDGKCEDGMMALLLSQLGKIKLVKGAEAMAWTSDRRLMSDGGLANAISKRIKREMKKFKAYLKPVALE
jgi:glycosyltransferase involved in cell wall biosynthesis